MEIHGIYSHPKDIEGEVPLIVIPHGVNEKTFHVVSDEDKIQIRKEYGIENDAFILTNIGAMTENKGVEKLIAAYGILKKRIDNLKLILKDQSNLYEITTAYLFDKINFVGYHR